MWEQTKQALNESTLRVLNQFAGLVPGVVALIIALALATLVAALVSLALRRSLGSIRFDEQVARWGYHSRAGAPPVGRQSPALLVARVAFWAIVLVGFLIGITAFDSSLTSTLVVRMFTYLPNVVAAVLVLAAGSVVARYLARSVLIGAVNMNLQYASILAAGTKWMILVLCVAMALEHLGIGGTIVYLAFGILFGGIVLALALAVGLGSKDFVIRSLERESHRRPLETEEPFRHL
jgi:hypothetical protein